VKSERAVRMQLNKVYKELNKLTYTEPGTGSHSRLRRYADALEWVLEEE
jgi:hypothetical protein